MTDIAKTNKSTLQDYTMHLTIQKLFFSAVKTMTFHGSLHPASSVSWLQDKHSKITTHPVFKIIITITEIHKTKSILPYASFTSTQPQPQLQTKDNKLLNMHKF